MNKETLWKMVESQLVRHTAQAIGGAITFTAFEIPSVQSAFTGEGVSIESFSQLAAGVLVQSAVYAFSKFVARRKARRAAKEVSKTVPKGV